MGGRGKVVLTCDLERNIAATLGDGLDRFRKRAHFCDVTAGVRVMAAHIGRHPSESPRVIGKSSRFPTATGGRGADGDKRQFVRSAWGRVTVPGLASATRPAWSRYAFGSTPQSFADSIRL